MRHGGTLMSDVTLSLAVPMCVSHSVGTKRVSCGPSYGWLMVQKRNGPTSGQKGEKALGHFFPRDLGVQETPLPAKGANLNVVVANSG